MKKIYNILLLFIFIINYGFGQTTLINSAGDGGFETGTTVAANNWTSNGATNLWQIGNAPGGQTGARCAYISNGGAGGTWTYTNSASKTSHLYRSINFPAGETSITLSFKWKCNGESGWDRLLVYTNTAAPASGTPASSTTAWGTAVLVGGPYNTNTTWQNVTITLPAALAGTTRNLIFTWQNDGSGGSDGPAAIDDISLISSPPPPAPTNDLCSGATNLPCGTTNLAGTTVNTVSESTFPTTYASKFGVWYSFVGNGQQTTISSVAGAGFDHGLVIMSGSACGSYALITDQDGATSGGTETYTFTSTNAVTYYVYVAYYGTTGTSTNTGTFTISRTCTAPPSNDAPCSATPATVNADLLCGSVTAGSTTAATNSGIVACAGTADDDVWFSFVATSTVHNFSLLNITGSVANMVHEIFSGACGSLTSIACSDPNSSQFSGFVVSNTYYIRVYTNTATGGQTVNFNLCIGTPPPPPANDLCVNATSLPCGTSNLAGSTTSASNIAHGTTCSMSNYGVWYSFVGDGNNTTITVNNSYDIELSISSGSCGTFTNVVCSDFPEDHTFTTVNGVTYYVYVAGWLTGDTETGTFDISRTCAAPPVPTCSDGIQNGDETAVDCGGTVCNPCIVPAEVCEDANPFCSDLVYNFPTTVDAGDAVVGPDYGCLGDQPNPVWYYLLVDANGDLEIEIASDCGDVDYAAWGPFSSTTCDNSDLTTSGNFMYEFYGASTYSEVDAFSAPSGNMVDCSYDIDAIEYLYISNAVIGEYYVVLITNYDNCDGLLTFSQISGSGSSNCNIVLPVKLMSFTAKAMENYNILDWQTATEVNNDYFVVESSTDMISFKEIGRVDGAGNSNNVLSYQFVDYTSFEKVVYYRLKQVDFDGVYTFSEIVAVKKTNEGEVNIYPNPATEVLFLDINSKEEAVYTIRYVNVLGATVQEKLVVAAGSNTYQLAEFKQLNSGIYFVQLINENNEVIKYQKIVKE